MFYFVISEVLSQLDTKSLESGLSTLITLLKCKQIYWFEHLYVEITENLNVDFFCNCIKNEIKIIKKPVFFLHLINQTQYFVESLSASITASFSAPQDFYYQFSRPLICTFCPSFPGNISELSSSALNARLWRVMIWWLLESLQICSEALFDWPWGHFSPS